MDDWHTLRLATVICWLGRDSYHRNLLIPRCFFQNNMMCRSNANPMPFLHEPPEWNDSIEGTCKPFRSPKPRYGPRSLPMVPKAYWWHSRCRVRHLVGCKLSSHAASTSCLSPIYWVSMSCGEMRVSIQSIQIRKIFIPAALQATKIALTHKVTVRMMTFLFLMRYLSFPLLAPQNRKVVGQGSWRWHVMSHWLLPHDWDKNICLLSEQLQILAQMTYKSWVNQPLWVG